MSSRTLLRQRISDGLDKYERDHGIVSGLADDMSRKTLIEQVVESVHRVEYVKAVQRRGVSAGRADPVQENLFDPLLAAIYHQRQGNLEEAFWLTFLFTYFGKSGSGGWRYSREFYGKLSQGGRWDWVAVSNDPGAVATWIGQNIQQLSRPGGGFGNHRKYESWGLTGEAIRSYVAWVGPTHRHSTLIEHKVREAGSNPVKAFDLLYKSMNPVYRFGRMAKFDYLTMLGKLGLANILPGSAYIVGATGPRDGGRLLFGNPYMTSREIDNGFITLARYLRVGLQEVEDSICNWQKSPLSFKAFRD